jgi:two-component system, sensor histidine kinase
MLHVKIRSPRPELKTKFGREMAMPAISVALDAHILVVDNDRRVGTTLGFMLASRGYKEIRTVRSAARALAIAEQFRPGIVFLDLELPDMASLDVAQRLRGLARQRTLRLIALTHVAEHPMREAARQVGFERFLMKPVSQEELDKILGNASSS